MVVFCFKVSVKNVFTAAFAFGYVRVLLLASGFDDVWHCLWQDLE
jgi:hypothetical protein